MGTELEHSCGDRDEGARRHPTRAAILTVLSSEGGGRKLSASEIRKELPDAPTVPVVAYHMLVLLEAELVRVMLGRAGALYSLAQR